MVLEAIPDTASVRAEGRHVPVRVFDQDVDGGVDAAVIIVPAMGVPARHYDRLATALVASGRRAVTVELPGCGDSPVSIDQDAEIGYQDLISGEVAAAVSFAERRWPGTPRVLVGHSLGGQLALLYASANADRVEAVALPAAGTVHWRAFPLVTGLGILAFTQLARAIAAMAGVFPGDRFGFGGRQPRRLIHDWARTASTGRWDPAEAVADYHQLLSQLHLPVLSVTLEGDHFAPPSAAAALTSPLPDQHVEHVHLSVEQLKEPADHLRWLKTPEPIAATISTWLAGHRTRPTARRSAQPV